MRLIFVICFVALFVFFPTIGAMKSYPTPPPGALDNLPSGIPVPPLGVIGENYLVIHDVPIYLWHHGCSPTAIGMVLGYYDTAAGTDFLNDTDPYESIASIEHYNDYSLPEDNCCFGCLIPDKSQVNQSSAHANNCIADFLMTSWSSMFCCYGATLTSVFSDGIFQYNDYAEGNISVIRESENVTYSDLKSEITAGRPVLLSVDSDSDGEVDHSVVAVGWSEVFTPPRVGIFTTWDTNIWWIKVHPVIAGDSWGVGNSYVIDLGDFNVTVPGEDNPLPMPGFELPLIIGAICILLLIERKR
jgi:hypothetical protein